MALNKLNGKQIRDGVIVNAHVNASAAIAESKLNISWSSRYQSALESKKLLDYVQLDNIDIGGTGDVSSIAVVQGSGTGEINRTWATLSTDKGVTNAAKVIIRDHATGNPITNVSDQEIWGLISFDTDHYDIAFKTGTLGSPSAATIPADTVIDMQYAVRFDLYDVPETFAMNEKFVDGGVDVTEILNLKQLARDLYGSSWSLDNDGDTNLTTSITGQIDLLNDDVDTSGSVLYMIKHNAMDVLASTASGDGAAKIGINDTGDYFTATTVEGALQEIRADLAATTENNGAMMVGIYDAGNKITATTVNGALLELEDRIGDLETGGGSEVANTHTREAASANDFFLPTAETPGVGEIAIYDSLEARLLAIETVVDTIGGDLDTLELNLASTTSGSSGASMIGISDATSVFTATDVQGVLVELEGRINTLEDNGGAEVTATHVRELGATFSNVSTITVDGTASGTAFTASDDCSGTVSAGNVIKVGDYEYTVASIANGGLTINIEGTIVATVDDVQLQKAATKVYANDTFVNVNFASIEARIVDVEKVVDSNVAGLATLISDLADVTDGSAGADMIGFTKGTAFTGETVQAVIEEIDTHLKATTDSASGADYVGATAISGRTGTTVQALLEDISTDLGTVETWKSNNATKIHTHAEEVKAVDTDTTEYTLVNTNVKTTDFMAVYVNGVRQLPGTHFTTTTADGKITKITFLDTLVDGDNIYLEFMIYNAA